MRKAPIFILLAALSHASCSHNPEMAQPLSQSEVMHYQNRPDLADATLQAVNQVRRQQGLPPFEKHQGLDSLAAAHVIHVARNAERARTGGGKTTMHQGFAIRNQQANGSMGLRLNGENILISKRSGGNPEHWVQEWLNSDSHRRNVLGKSRFSGLAVLTGPGGELSIVQLYGTPASGANLQRQQAGRTWFIY